MLPVVKCKYAVGILYLTSVCQTLNPIAGHTIRVDPTAILNDITNVYTCLYAIDPGILFNQ